MKANKFQVYLIVFRSLFSILITSLHIIIRPIYRKWKRKEIDALSRKWAKKILDIVKVSYEVFNPYDIQLQLDHRYIIMSNHCSHYDIPLIFMTLDGSIRMMSKKELFRVPIWGCAMKIAECLSIDRDNRKQAAQDLKIVKEKMQTGIIPWIAPEGTRSRTGKLQPFKKGGFMIARQTKAIIIPIGIRGSGKILPPKTLDFHIGERVEIYIGKPIDAASYPAKDKEALIKEVENQIRLAIS